MEKLTNTILDEYYVFTIDCTEYSGNYERQMTAYITGVYGECEVGKDIADEIESELEGFRDEIDGIIMHQPDERGCSRPCEIVPTPGWINNGMGVNSRINPDDQSTTKGYDAYNSVGIFLFEIPSDELLQLFCDRAKNFTNYISKKKQEAESTDKYYYACAENVDIDGFRILQRTTTCTTLKIWK